jgi:beta-N-acetylhexosaminidase
MRNPIFTRLCIAFFVLSASLSSNLVIAAPQFQTGEFEARASNILENMTPEERVGQLFLVSFDGTEVGPDTQIYDLITNHYIGGVVLLSNKDNFTASTYHLIDLWTLINQLQTTRYATSQNLSGDSDSDTTTPPAYVPLFIGISQEGDGYPNDQILDGLTPLPSQLSIGATWNTELAYRVGNVAGIELSDLGFNLIFGPSLDVLENPLLQGASELGARSFGGDPYWVGEMGRAYIRGLHEGSVNRIAVAGTHFPGLGSADHVPEDEVATVRKSLEQLKQIELAPFFTVTGNAITQTERVDALLTSHIRYQGLQGNIRSTTRPIGFDQQALNLLMQQPAFSTWREDGGVMISDDLGSRAVRRFYDPTEQEFNARRLALDAFLAGNDILYLNNFIEAEDPDAYTTILRTIEFFTQKYREDPLFAERVDRSALRILSLKYKLYDVFNLNNVLTSSDLNRIGKSSQVTFDVARQGVTLISPTVEELDTVLPEIPGRTDRIVFFTDSFNVKQCTNCPDQSVLSYDALPRAILNQYGPQAGGLVSQFYLRAYSYEQLVQFLNGEENYAILENDLNITNWIIFTMLDVTSERPNTQVLERFLAERPDLLREKRVIVFTANAPNYLDSTDISKLTAYVGLFSKSQPFIDIAARVLFKEIARPPGSLPVSVPGVGYDLILATSPDPDQIIPILLDLPEGSSVEDISPPEGLPLPEFRIGELIPLRTGYIVDSNNHPVPNNTPVQFTITLNGEEAPPISSTTVDGYAQAEYIVGQSGTLAIQAVSGLAKSNTLLFEIPFEEPTPEPSPTITPTDTPTSEPSPTSLPPTPVPTPDPNFEESGMGIEDWLGALVVVTFMGWGATRTGALLGKVRWGIRWGLSAFIGGLLFYTYVVLNLPISEVILSLSNTWGLLLATFLGTVVGWLVALSVSIAKSRHM